MFAWWLSCLPGVQELRTVRRLCAEVPEAGNQKEVNQLKDEFETSMHQIMDQDIDSSAFRQVLEP